MRMLFGLPLEALACSAAPRHAALSEVQLGVEASRVSWRSSGWLLGLELFGFLYEP